jgi:hypothetical protein
MVATAMARCSQAIPNLPDPDKQHFERFFLRQGWFGSATYVILRLRITSIGVPVFDFKEEQKWRLQ